MILESQVPAILKDAVMRATSLSQALAAPELLARLDRWAIGRAEEITRFVELVLDDWRSGALSDRTACEELESYVRTLEAAVREELEMATTPARPSPFISSGARHTD